MKFIGLYTFLCCIVACQSGNNIAPISKFKDVGDDIVSSNLENPKKDISKKDAAESSNKFFEYIPNCYYNASVNGIVNGKAANYISIINPGLFNKPTEEQLEITDNNKFSGSVNIDEPAYYQLQHKQNNYLVYLMPGDRLNVEIDHSTDQGLTFSGSGKSINNFLRCNYLQEKVFDKDKGKNLQLNFKKFNEVVDYERTVMKNELKAVVEKSDSINGRFVALQNMNIDFDWALKHLNYQKHNFKDPRAIYHSNGKYLNELSFYDDFLELANFRKFVYSYFDFFSKRYIEDTYGEDGKYQYSPEERAKMRYNRINFMFKDKAIRDFVKTKLISETIDDLQAPLVNKLPIVNQLVTKHKKEVSQKDYVTHIEKCYHKNIPVDDGTIAPDFAVKNAEGNKLELADLKGKWAYIAVWATWCAPCKIEQPHLETLKQEYAKNKNIEILSVSIDEEAGRWKNAISKGNITEPQYIAPGNWNSEFASAFNLTSVPKYILIDPDGQINDLSTSKPSADIRIKFDHLGI